MVFSRNTFLKIFYKKKPNANSVFFGLVNTRSALPQVRKPIYKKALQLMKLEVYAPDQKRKQLSQDAIHSV